MPLPSPYDRPTRRESEASRYLRSTISNIAFLVAIGYFVHQKALSETSLVTIMTLFIGGYFGVRAYQHRTEADVTVSQSNPRFPIPNYKGPQDPPDPPTGGVHDAVTRPVMEQQRPIVPRVDDPSPSGPGPGRGRYRRLAAWLFRSEMAPVVYVVALCILLIVVRSAFGLTIEVVGLKTAFAR